MGDAGDGCRVGLRAWSGINFSIGVEGFWLKCTDHDIFDGVTTRKGLGGLHLTCRTGELAV